MWMGVLKLAATETAQATYRGDFFVFGAIMGLMFGFMMWAANIPMSRAALEAQPLLPPKFAPLLKWRWLIWIVIVFAALMIFFQTQGLLDIFVSGFFAVVIVGVVGGGFYIRRDRAVALRNQDLRKELAKKLQASFDAYLLAKSAEPIGELEQAVIGEIREVLAWMTSETVWWSDKISYMVQEKLKVTLNNLGPMNLTEYRDFVTRVATLSEQNCDLDAFARST